MGVKVIEGTNTQEPIAAIENEKITSKKEYVLPLTLSHSLYKKVIDKAAIEGVSTDQLMVELVSEGLVLRAWEIMEKKIALRGGQNLGSQQKAPHGYSSGSSTGAGQGRYNRGGRNNTRGGGGNWRNNNNNKNNIMDDRASFLEYVRNQEKRQK